MSSAAPAELRKAFSSFATGVTVITGIGNNHQPVGVTISSFNTVSLDPPLVLWSLSERSVLMDAFVLGKKQLIHVLERSQEDIAMRFAKSTGDQFVGIDLVTGASGLATLPDCVAYFECETIAVHPGGDHRIIVARVINMQHHEERNPLIFSRSQFMGLRLPERAPIE
jgi:flavin reductase (DIM6/NTAB) family NADH-FMN oxidoreductase RutF